MGQTMSRLKSWIPSYSARCLRKKWSGFAKIFEGRVGAGKGSIREGQTLEKST